MKTRILWPALLLLCCAPALMVPSSAFGQVWAGQPCTCDNSATAICNYHGYEITLTSHSIDQTSGTSSWDYQVCNNTGSTTGAKFCFKGKCGDGRGCNDSSQCSSGSCTISGTIAEKACSTDADCGGGFCMACVPLGRTPFSRFYVTLPGPDCLASTTGVTIQQIEGQSMAALTCQVASVSQPYPSPCQSGATRFAGCNLNAGSSFDAGECVKIRITIPGEVPSLGAGAVGAATTQERFCDESCMLGPSCQACEEPQPGGGCLTRTAGFWGTHPAITGQFLNGLTVCGQPLTTTQAGSCSSVTEALCVSPGRESRGNPAYAQLVRQLAAAKLNLAASRNGCGPEIVSRIAQCEALCGASQQTISASGCIEDLERFNESQDTVPITPAPFDTPGPAQPTQCQTANGNGIVIGPSCTAGARGR